MNYEDDLRIDPNALDIEWLDQPKLYMQYAEEAADASREVDKTKERLEVTRAELDGEIRSKAEDKGEKKPTEGAILMQIQTHPRYQQAISDFNEAKYNQNMMNAAVKAFEQRKVALENLVRLHGSSYFAGPSIPRELTQEFIDSSRSKRVASKSREKMKAMSEKKKSRRTK